MDQQSFNRTSLTKSTPEYIKEIVSLALLPFT